jgi:hypothetical protein
VDQVALEASILTSIKKNLNIEEDDTDFDQDIMLHINSVFTTLADVGVGDAAGFMIEDSSAEWDDFLAADPRLNSVKTYIYLRVRLLFDPPQTSYLVDALKEQATEILWRLNVLKEATIWTDPTPEEEEDP